MRGYEMKQQGSHSAAWPWLQIRRHCAPTSCAPPPYLLPRSCTHMPHTCILHRHIVAIAVSWECLPLVHGIALVLLSRRRQLTLLLLLQRLLLLDGATRGRKGLLGPCGQ